MDQHESLPFFFYHFIQDKLLSAGFSFPLQVPKAMCIIFLAAFLFRSQTILQISFSSILKPFFFLKSRHGGGADV
jgi:hypothetical protein